MESVKAVTELVRFARKTGSYVYSTAGLAKLLHEPRCEGTIHETLRRLVSQDVLVRPTRGVYVLDVMTDDEVLYQIADVARHRELKAEPLETAGSKWGIISQVYFDYLTCVTTGRSGTIECKYGQVDFVHTEMGKRELRERCARQDRGPFGFLLTNEETTRLFLRRTGRAKDLVDEDKETFERGRYELMP